MEIFIKILFVHEQYLLENHMNLRQYLICQNSFHSCKQSSLEYVYELQLESILHVLVFLLMMQIVPSNLFVELPQAKWDMFEGYVSLAVVVLLTHFSKQQKLKLFCMSLYFIQTLHVSNNSLKLFCLHCSKCATNCQEQIFMAQKSQIMFVGRYVQLQHS